MLEDYGRNTVVLDLGDGARAERFAVGLGATSRGLESLVKESIIRNVPVGDFYNTLSERGRHGSANASTLVEEVAGRPLGLVRSTGRDGEAEWWVLPAVTTHRATWLAAAFALWKSKWPDEFPPAGYGALERWMTHAELEAAAAISAHEVETAAYLAKRTAELDVLRLAASEASNAAESGERTLLQAQGDELVGAVMSCLKDLGFEVFDSDAEAEANKAAKREDLRIKSERDADWLSLVEVKGYASRNAKTSDINQLARAAGFFESRTGDVPQAQWYVINAQFSLAPDERPIPLASSPEDVEEFAKDGGLVVDTRELFKLLRLVQSGAISQQDAQADLVHSTGTYECSFGPDVAELP
ncbi:hypothetical protein [Arthrobacter sp. S2(2024)]|uniref:hypothetical protein n=1 Tax=Arthrobacter sp. S2(2024) TaxID=3111911 RepID=UPI002FCBF940